MSQDEFTKLYRYMQKEFDYLRENKAEKSQIDNLYKLMDGFIGELRDIKQEQAITTHRHEQWIGQLATNTKTKLVPEP